MTEAYKILKRECANGKVMYWTGSTWSEHYTDGQRMPESFAKKVKTRHYVRELHTTEDKFVLV